ncbi:MAG: lysylphosphatidylglycerol synthase transmembrane domain-containing protein [Thermoanaerobaculia bacterium]
MRKALRIALIAAATIVLLALFLRNSDPGEVMAALRSVHPAWFAAGLLVNFTALALRAFRWRTILGAAAETPPIYDTFLSTAIGFMSSAVLPIRAGDVIRPALLSRRTGVRFSTALGTVVSERLIDLTSNLTLFIIFAMTGGRALSANPATAKRALVIHSAASIAAIALVTLLTIAVLLYFFRERARLVQLRVSTWLPKRFRHGWVNFFDALAAALRILGRPRIFVRVFLLTVGIWTCLTAQYILVLHAMNRPLPYVASFLIATMAIVGLAIPTPGGVGGFHKAAQIALTTFYGFDVSSSVAVALVFHIVGILPVVLTGFVLFAREGMSFRQLARMGESAGKAIENGAEP